MTNVNAERAADMVLPLDGPYDPEAVVEAARTIGELVRRLNHATRHHTAFRYPSELDRVLWNLNSAGQGLVQTLNQLAARLDAWALDPLLGADRGSAPLVAGQAADGLRTAAQHLDAVTFELGWTASNTSQLNYAD